MTELGKVSFICGCYRVVVTNVVDYGGLPALLSGPRPVWPDLMIELWCGRWAAGRALASNGDERNLEIINNRK